MLKDENEYRDVFYYLGLLGQLGFTIVGTIIFFIVIYKSIAKFTGENTLLFFLFVIGGVFYGFYNAYKLIMKK